VKLGYNSCGDKVFIIFLSYLSPKSRISFHGTGVPVSIKLEVPPAELRELVEKYFLKALDF